MLTLLILKGRGQFYYFKIVVNILCNMIFFHGNLMGLLTSCLWKFCLIYGILAFSDEIQDLKVEVLPRRGLRLTSYICVL